MAFEQWQFYKGHAAQQTFVDVSSPIVQQGSLRLIGGGSTAGIVARWSIPGQRGFLNASAQTLVQPLSGTSGVDLYGVYGLASQEDLTGNVGTWVGCALRPGTPWTFVLLRGLTGMAGLSVVASVPLTTADYNQVHAVHLAWQWYAAAGLTLQGWHGMAEDYSDLALRVSWQDLAAPQPILSAGEGPLGYLSVGGACQYDTTETLGEPQ